MMMKIQDILMHNPLERIYLCKKEIELLNQFWEYPLLFSESFCVALHLKYESNFNQDNNEKQAEIFHFIEYSSQYLLKNPNDVLRAIKTCTDDEIIDAFLSEFVSDPMRPTSLLLALVRSQEFLAATTLCNNWLDFPLRVHANFLLSSSDKRTYSLDELIPCGISRGKFTSQYILSWAFEEDRLSLEGIETFKREYPKKFEMLKQIKKRLK